jgi:hypothetical protein
METTPDEGRPQFEKHAEARALEAERRALLAEGRAAEAEQRALEAERRERETQAALEATEQLLRESERRRSDAEERAIAVEVGAVAVAGVARQHVSRALGPTATGVIFLPQKNKRLVEAEFQAPVRIEEFAVLAKNYWSAEGFRLSNETPGVLQFRRGGTFAEAGSMKAGLLTGWKRGRTWADAPLLLELRVKVIPGETEVKAEVRVGVGWGPLDGDPAGAFFKLEFREPASRCLSEYASHLLRWQRP